MLACVAPFALRTMACCYTDGMTEPMSCLTLWQPYASLAALGIKHSETRHWSAGFNNVGQRIGIHAAQRGMTPSEIAWFNAACACEGISLRARDLPLGVMLATARLTGIHRIITHRRGTALLDGHAPIPLDAWGTYTPGRWVYLLDQVEPLVKPVAASGRQRWWHWHPAAMAA